MEDCPKCVAGSLLYSDTFQAWECDLCGEVVEMGEAQAQPFAVPMHLIGEPSGYGYSAAVAQDRTNKPQR